MFVCFWREPRRLEGLLLALAEKTLGSVASGVSLEDLVSLRSVICRVGSRATWTILRIFKDVKTTRIRRVQRTQHSTGPRLRKTEDVRWKIDCEMKEGKRKTLLYLPSLKSLNYYWLLIILFNIVHLCGPIRIQGILVWHVHIIHLPVF